MIFVSPNSQPDLFESFSHSRIRKITIYPHVNRVNARWSIFVILSDGLLDLAAFDLVGSPIGKARLRVSNPAIVARNMCAGFWYWWPSCIQLLVVKLCRYKKISPQEKRRRVHQ